MPSGGSEDLYTALAEQQLDDLEAGAPAELYNAVLACIDYVLDDTEAARQKAPPLHDAEGRALLSTVLMYDKDPGWFAFWRNSTEGPVIVGVGPLPTF